MWKLVPLLISMFLLFPTRFACGDEVPNRHGVLLIVIDGLRPDYVTSETTPNLFQLGAKGVFAERHHSAFPTLTRVNSAVIATGAYPEQNGLLGNQVYFPDVRPGGSISTWDADNLIRLEEAEYGRLITSTTLCEMLAAHGAPMLVCGSGSSGASFLQNHKLNGAVINVNASYPESIREEIERVLGPVPMETSPNRAQATWAVDAYLTMGLDKMHPALSVVWLNEPDHTAHEYGIGAPETEAALGDVDSQVGRIIGAHSERGLDVNIIVISDHGFVTHVGDGQSLVTLLEREGLKTSANDIVEVGGAIYINEDKENKLPRIVELLRAQPWIGAIYTRPSEKNPNEGMVPGTLSTNIIRWNHRRAADVFVEPDWNHDENEFGFKGSNLLSGEAAGHGSSSPYEVRATLLAAGPAFEHGLRSKLPTGNVDIAPTIAHLLGYRPAETMQGRILFELLQDGRQPSITTVEEKEITVSSDSYTVTACIDVFGEYTYLNYVKAKRSR